MAFLISIRHADSKNGNCNRSRCDDRSHNHHGRSNIIAVQRIDLFEPIPRDTSSYLYSDSNSQPVTDDIHLHCAELPARHGRQRDSDDNEHRKHHSYLFIAVRTYSLPCADFGTIALGCQGESARLRRLSSFPASSFVSSSTLPAISSRFFPLTSSLSRSAI